MSKIDNLTRLRHMRDAGISIQNAAGRSAKIAKTLRLWFHCDGIACAEHYRRFLQESGSVIVKYSRLGFGTASIKATL